MVGEKKLGILEVNKGKEQITERDEQRQNNTSKERGRK